MKKHFLQLFVLLLISLPAVLQAQTYVIDNFDSSAKDTIYQKSVEGGISKIVLTDDTADKKEGAASLKVNATIDALHQWGTFAQLIRTTPKDVYWDWSSSDSLSIWIKVTKAPTHPEWMVFRIQLGDQPTPEDAKEEYVYENAVIVDATTDWIQLKVPFTERVQTGTDVPNDQGFILAPTSWGGFTYNNKKLDRNKIVSYNLGLITSGWDASANLPADSLEVRFDNFTRFGTRKVPFVVFNGKTVISEFTNWGGWGGSAAVETGSGSLPGKAAVKWTAGGGWSGLFFDLPEKNMGGNWALNDTLKMKVKVPADYGDDIRVQFLSNTAEAGKDGAIKYILKESDYHWDGSWKEVKIPLKTWVVSDGKTGFDSTKVKKFEILTEKGTSKACTIYLDDVWMGNPEFDVIAPAAPTELQATPSSDNMNIIGWKDVAGESGEVYNVYYSENPIVNVSDPGVEQLKLNVPHGTGQVEHLLRAPQTEKDLSYYYAVTCTDAAGNVGVAATTASVQTNKAKGVPTIALQAPKGFKADGDPSEFVSLYSSLNYKPFTIRKSEGTGFVVANNPVTDDNDCSALVYLAVTSDSLYVAFDITDDYVDGSSAPENYKRDCPDLFIGLYNFHGAMHTSPKRGATPEYHFRFNENKSLLDGQGLDSIDAPGVNYYWGEKSANGYVVETRISLKDLVTRRSGDRDSLFVPVEGMRIPIDFSLNDADQTTIREGILTYSPYNEDKSYLDASRWLYTWLGNKMTVTGVENEKNATVKSYSLSQNYPNPFNPSTTIRYSIPQAGMVTLKVFNVLGKEVATLVNEEKNQGSFEVKFDASRLASGIYFYQLESGSFRQVNKMLLLK